MQVFYQHVGRFKISVVVIGQTRGRFSKKNVHANALKGMASRKGNLAFSMRGSSERRDGASDSRFDSQNAGSSPRQMSPSRSTPRSNPGSYESYGRDNEAIPPLSGDYRSLPANTSPPNQTSLLFNSPNPYMQSSGQGDRWVPSICFFFTDSVVVAI